MSINVDRLEAVTRWQQALVDAQVLPCAQTRVGHGGEIVFEASAGWSDAAAQQPIRSDSIFRLYSMTKPLVSIALMLLYEEGRFQLNDPIYHYLGDRWKPENMAVFVDWEGGERGRKNCIFATQPCESAITVGQILTHTAGLSYGFDPSGRGIPVDRVYAKKFRHPARNRSALDPNDPSMMRAFCDALAEMPLKYQPGTQWNYSYAADVAGALIELLSGESLDAFLAKRLFEPLGMVDTGFDVSDADAARLVHNYRYVAPDAQGEAPANVVGGTDALLFPHRGGFVDIDADSRSGYLDLSRPKFLSGGGGLVGTSADYAAFCAMILAGGVNRTGDRVIGRKTLEFVASNHLPGAKLLSDMVPNPAVQYSETAKNGGSFGLGFAIVESPQAAGQIGSQGSIAWGGAASTIFWIDPSEDLYVVFCTQVMGMQPANALRAKLGSFVYAALSS